MLAFAMVTFGVLILFVVITGRTDSVWRALFGVDLKRRKFDFEGPTSPAVYT